MNGNTLDLVLSSNPGMVQNVEMLGRIGASDHEALMVDIQIDAMTRQVSEMFRNFKNANYVEMRRDLQINWEEELRGLDVEMMWEKIRMRITEAVEKHVPLRRNRMAGKPKWLNHEILTLIGRKRKAWQKWKECASEENKRVYKCLEKEVKRKEDSIT